MPESLSGRFDRMKKAWISLLRKKATGDSAKDVGTESDDSPIHLVDYTSSQLKAIANNFEEENFVTKTHFGKLYRGEIPHGIDEDVPRRVTVKIWQHLQWGFPSFGKPNGYVVDKKSKLMNEVYFLSHPSVRNHPNLVKLIGYCCDEDEGLYAVVYDLDPLDTLHNLITKASFPWGSRIKVALELAGLLAFLHGHELPYMVRNLDAMHVMVDERYRPVLFEFGTLTGGIMGELKDILEEPNPYPLMGSQGYMDPHMAATGVFWCVQRDVYAYGVILISMLEMKVVDKDHIDDTIILLATVKADYERERECGAGKLSVAWHTQGFGVDETSILSILGNSNLEHKKSLRQGWSKFFSEDEYGFERFDPSHVKSLKLEFKRFRDAVMLSVLHPWERDARLIEKAIKKGPKHYNIIVEIACSRSSEELLGARKAYHSLFDQSMEEDIAAHVKGSERKDIALYTRQDAFQEVFII
ncbi:hypothetical protein CCACVL1_29007 [Corchorus capsularis]|uniref:Protein kinase domain-containing protein n=1 Tax=Corchorus capsularis TaxID=210143 RepID=A0A1R3G4B9_COCAP|nr:hypothetical protein CCACVL1_29007 [Corchorus capsularis]